MHLPNSCSRRLPAARESARPPSRHRAVGRTCRASVLGALSLGFSLPSSLPARFCTPFWSSESRSNW